jgi:hypothetical protein
LAKTLDGCDDVTTVILPSSNNVQQNANIVESIDLVDAGISTGTQTVCQTGVSLSSGSIRETRTPDADGAVVEHADHYARYNTNDHPAPARSVVIVTVVVATQISSAGIALIVVCTSD